MLKTKAMLAIFASLVLGIIAAALAGCQPPPQPRERSNSTDAVTAPPLTETTPAVDPAPVVEPAAVSDPVQPQPLPTEGDPAGKAAIDDPANPPKNAPVIKPLPTEGNPSGEPPSANEGAAANPPAAVVAAAPVASDEKADPSSNTGSGAASSVLKEGDWNQWGGSPLRNNTPGGANVPLTWNIGKFDRKTGAWKSETAKNIKWVAALGSQTYGNTVVGSGKVFLGTNNSNGYLKRYPSDVDLGVFICFDEKDGKFLWQQSSEKLPTGRVHDWPLQGICASGYVEGERVWIVTSRGEVRCLDTEGFYDGEDDGPVKNELARLFDVVKGEDEASDKQAPILADLEAGKLNDDIRGRFTKAGFELSADATVTKDEKAKAPAKKWLVKGKVDGADREVQLSMQGPRLSAFKVVTADDKQEADTIWIFDMMKELGTSQHNMCSCSVTAVGNVLFVNTSNGVDEAHISIPAPDAPSFIAMDKNTGKVLWTDNSPRNNILHGQWSSPTVATLGGVPQVIFGGGDGWMYSFKADEGKDGKPELLWKFDANAKDTILELGGRGTRNDIISTPVVYDGKVYFATGQDPEHGEGEGTLWCIDPTKRGDVSEQLAVKRDDPKTSIPVKRIQAVVESEGDVAVPNPNSAVVWKYNQQDRNGDGTIDFDETFHRSISTVAIKDGMLFVPDFSGVFHCVDAKTGKVNWAYDMLSAAWGSSMIADGHVYVGDEDGDIAIFNLSADPKQAMQAITIDDEEELHPINAVLDGNNVSVTNMNNSVYSTPVFANGVLYIANKDHVFAIVNQEGSTPAEPKTAAVEAAPATNK